MKCALCRDSTSAQFICSSCCASTRRSECGGCSYYETSLAYQRERQVRNRPFICEVIPDVDDRCDEALALIDKGDIARGEAVLENLRLQYSDYHTVLYGLGICYGLKGRMDAAISCLERAVEIFPGFAHAYYNLGSSYSQKYDLENAVKAYEAAIAVDGRDGPVGRLARERLDSLEDIVKKSGVSLATHIGNSRIFDRAFSALRDRKFQAAIDLFEQVLATEKDHVQSYGNMGLAYAGLGNKQKALECLNRAIELDPEYEPAIVNRLVIESLKDGEAVPDIGSREINRSPWLSPFSDRGPALRS